MIIRFGWPERMIVMTLINGRFRCYIWIFIMVSPLRFTCCLVLIIMIALIKICLSWIVLSCLFCYLPSDGIVIANETHLKRCFAMHEQIKQYFSPNFAIVNMDANNLPSLFLTAVKLFILSLCSHSQTCKKEWYD